jgi:hypothetical protein
MNSHKSSLNRTIWHKYRPFWWPKSVLIIFFFSLPLESDNLSLSSLKKGLKTNKNELLYQNLIWKKLRHWNRIIYVISKVRRLKYIFPEASVTPPMFNAFLILVFILLISPLPKKFKLISLQSWSNHPK